MNLRPFFSFYGSKWRVAKYYPEPQYNTIIEPFAGSAGYAVRHPSHNIILVERDPIIASVWRYLISTTPNDILALPNTLEDGLDPAEKALIGFWLNKGTTQPSKTPSAWMRTDLFQNQFWGPNIRQRIASQVPFIAHWQLIEDSYEATPNIEATWFIDPPYSTPAGRHYKYNDIDYDYLGRWAKERQGQTIVCEQIGANWLPFQPFRNIKANVATGHSQEAIWTNERGPTT